MARWSLWKIEAKVKPYQYISTPTRHTISRHEKLSASQPHNRGYREARAGDKIEQSLMVAEAVVQASTVFAAFDKDGDGKVSAAELRGCMTAALGEDVSEEEAAAILATADANGDGVLDQEEFSKLGAAASHGGADGVAGDDDEVRRRCLKEAFAMYATEGGDEGARITPASLMRMLSKLLGSSTEKMELEECRAMICRTDFSAVSDFVQPFSGIGCSYDGYFICMLRFGVRAWLFFFYIFFLWRKVEACMFSASLIQWIFIEIIYD
uniref:Uncharacterized protein n=1 Tax=Avena sativa TaxID=4498 RepID=A0ACD5Y4B4_AVESA